MPIVEQLLNGVKVQCTDGVTVTVRPLPLGAAMAIYDHWNERADMTLTDEARAEARIAILRKFVATYPELADHISAGDVEELVPGFFWGRTGAAVLTPPSPRVPTGTPPGVNTSPIGENSPT
jgi:hypothetical protein